MPLIIANDLDGLMEKLEEFVNLFEEDLKLREDDKCHYQC